MTIGVHWQIAEVHWRQLAGLGSSRCTADTTTTSWRRAEPLWFQHAELSVGDVRQVSGAPTHAATQNTRDKFQNVKETTRWEYEGRKKPTGESLVCSPLKLTSSPALILRRVLIITRLEERCKAEKQEAGTTKKNTAQMCPLLEQHSDTVTQLNFKPNSKLSPSHPAAQELQQLLRAGRTCQQVNQDMRLET